MPVNSIATNLKRLRCSRGLTQDDLARKAKISRIAYSNVENGKSIPRVNNLQQIADALEVGIQELVTPVPTINSLRFRCKRMPTGHDKGSRDQIVADVAFWLRNYADLEEKLFKDRQYLLKGIKATTPKEYAIKVRDLLKLKNDEPINDICGLVEHAGIKIKFEKSDLDGFFGLSALDKNGYPAIVVNVREDISVERQIFTVAHELGHIVMHQNSYDGLLGKEKEQEEKEADQFASYFLMPQVAFEKSWQENKGNHWLKSILHIKRVYKISYQTVIYRLIESGVNSNLWEIFRGEYYRQFGIRLNKHLEPNKLDPLDFLEDRLSALTQEALEKKMISVSRAAEILDIGIDEMRNRINAWSLVHEYASI
jgi:Zn-dependent peptidase ImmA (M78 family)/DNA-binding XRE family transcriptional regulator